MNILGQPKGDTFEKFPEKFEEIFREAWTNNADTMSILYSGTPALKTDFTRTGKRTQKGAMMDGYHSVLRYYINNFTDGFNQDCLDYSTSKLSMRPSDQNYQDVRRGVVNSFFILLAIVRLSSAF